MNDNVILITGATSGIGKATALGLAETGASVVLLGRNAQKGARAMEEIKARTGSGKLDFLKADLLSMADVRRAAQTFKERHPRLDVLVNNAGAVFNRFEKTADGFERTFALNHLAPFLLTNLLLDVMKHDAPARIVTVSSIAHRNGRIDFADLQGEQSFSGLRSYADTKLMNVLFTYQLAKRLEQTGITANCLHPGVVASDFGDEAGGIVRALAWVVKKTVAISPEQGAKTSIYLASSPDVAAISGKYFVDCHERRSTKVSYDRRLQERLWDASERLVGDSFS